MEPAPTLLFEWDSILINSRFHLIIHSVRKASLITSNQLSRPCAEVP